MDEKYTKLYHDSTVAWCKRLDLKQYPPRARTTSPSFMKPLRLWFPWVSFGVFHWENRDSRKIDHKMAAYFHSRAWTDYEDAANILRVPPDYFHASLFFCPGNTADYLFKKGSITPAEAFWFTANVAMSIDDLPRQLREPGHDLSWVDRHLRPLKDHGGNIYAFIKYPT